MEEMELQDRPGWMSKFTGLFGTKDEEAMPQYQDTATEPRRTYAYTVTVRKDIMTFEDARAVANGIKRGEQQIINLNDTDAGIRQKVVDFLCGVNYAEDGTWEEIGTNIYMIAPMNAFIEVAPATPHSNSVRN
ncbi:Cell division protein SepF/SepF-related [Fimbriimonadaceae bacterium]|jgi:cell division inhibitor SepF